MKITDSNELVFLGAHQLARAIRERKVSAVEVLQAYLDQIARYNPALNAIVTLDAEGALKQAKAADVALKRGEVLGPLHGVPVTIKDCFETAGLRTTCGWKPLADYIPKQDATAVSRLRSAGAIILGKTNLPELSRGFQTDSPLLGRANNPWNLDYTTGGSTGGGAAALAAGLSPLEIGGDVGGSIRIPAHFCGVFGLKPTEHRVSYAGVVKELPGALRAKSRQLVIGPMARCIEDLRLCLSLIEGADGRQWEVPPAPIEKFSERPLKDYRFAWTDDFGGVPVTQETRTMLTKLAGALEDLGCRVEYSKPKGFDFGEAIEVCGEILGCEVNVTEEPAKVLLYRLLNKLPLNVGPLMRGIGKSSALNMRRYAQALDRRDHFMAKMENFLADWDAWICPVTPGPAFTHRKLTTLLGEPLAVEGQKLPYWVWGTSYAAIANLTGNPAVVLPVTQTAQNLPIGVQLFGRRWHDMELLSIAQKLSEEVTGTMAPRPPG
jgi:amidase